MTDLIIVYIPASDQDEAEKLSFKLLEDGLVACTNILGKGTSIYPWQGKIEKENEVYMIAKTTRAHFDEICSVIKNNHSYDTPCIFALPIIDGNQEYVDWVKAQIKK